MQREKAIAIGSMIGIGVIALLFWNAVWLWPLKILVVLFHEMGHALAAIATGGEVVSIELSPQQGGLCTTRGGLRFFVASAGYLGSIGFGALWLFLARTRKLARIGVWMLAAALLFATVMWVRPLIGFGFAFSLLATGVITALAYLTPAASQWILRTIGVFSVLYAVWDIRDDVLARPGMASDATNLAELTFIPGPVWGIVWLAVGLGTLFMLRKWIV